jgi:hypothetical protein
VARGARTLELLRPSHAFIATALIGLGMVMRRRRDYARSLAYIEEGLKRFRALGTSTGSRRRSLISALPLGPWRMLPARWRCSMMHWSVLWGSVIYAGPRSRKRCSVWRCSCKGDPDAAAHSVTASLKGHAALGDRWFVTYCLMALVRIQIAYER